VQIEIDDDALFVVEGDNGRVWRMPREGGEQQEIAIGLDRICETVSDQQFLYVLTCGVTSSVMALSKDGGGQITVATDQHEPYGLTVFEGDIFWVAGADIMHAQLAVEPTTFLTGIPFESAIAVDADNVYMTTRHSTLDDSLETNGLYALSRGAEGGSQLIAAVPELSGVIVAGSEIYATTLNYDRRDGSVLRILPDTQSYQVLAEHQKRVDSLILDGDQLYFAAEGFEGILHRVPKTGGAAPFTVASGHEPGESGRWNTCDYAVDDDTIFLATSGKVFRLPK
jgi:hypothetical protein